jgi:hypothetical protein
MGKFDATSESNDNIVTEPVFVVKGKYGNISIKYLTVFITQFREFT